MKSCYDKRIGKVKPNTRLRTDELALALPILAELFEIFLLKILRLLAENLTIPEFQFGFRDNRSVIEQIHRVVNVVVLLVLKQK